MTTPRLSISNGLLTQPHRFALPLGVIEADAERLSPAEGDARLIAQLRADVRDQANVIAALQRDGAPLQRVRTYWVGEDRDVTMGEWLRLAEALELAGHSGVCLRPFKQDGRFAGLELCVSSAPAPLSAA